MSAQWSPTSGDELFAALPGEVLQISTQELMLFDPLSDERHPMTPDVLDALEACQAFAPLSRHRDAIIEKLPQLKDQAAAVDQILLALMQRGLLVSAAEVLKSYAASARPTMAVAPACLRLGGGHPAIVDERDLQTLRELNDLCGGLRVLIGSAVSEEQQTRWQRALADASIDADWWDGERQSQFLSQLASDDADTDALFALAGPDGAGSADARLTNLALLLSSGRRMVILDSDQLAPLRASPQVSAGFDLSPSAARVAWFDTDKAATLPAGSFAAALDWCGRSLGQLLRPGGPLGLGSGDLSGRAVAEMRRIPGDGHVDSLIFGTVGALDIDHNRWLYSLDAQSRDRLWLPEPAYMERRKGRHLIHGISRARLLSGTPMAPSIMAVSEATGFYNPLSDQPHAYFGAFGQLLDPNRRSLHMPWCLPRSDSAEPDRITKGILPFVPSFNRMLSDWAVGDTRRCQAASAIDRANWWSAQLSDLAAADPAHRRTRLNEFVARAQAQLVSRLQYQLETAQIPPKPWRDDVVAIVESNARAILSGETTGLAGYEGDQAPEERFSDELNQVAAWNPRWLQWLQRAVSTSE